MISVFKLSPLMSSHQVSFAIFDLQKQIVEVNKTEVNLISVFLSSNRECVICM